MREYISTRLDTGCGNTFPPAYGTRIFRTEGFPCAGSSFGGFSIGNQRPSTANSAFLDAKRRGPPPQFHTRGRSRAGAMTRSVSPWAGQKVKWRHRPMGDVANCASRWEGSGEKRVCEPYSADLFSPPLLQAEPPVMRGIGDGRPQQIRRCGQLRKQVGRKRRKAIRFCEPYSADLFSPPLLQAEPLAFSLDVSGRPESQTPVAMFGCVVVPVRASPRVRGEVEASSSTRIGRRRRTLVCHRA